MGFRTRPPGDGGKTYHASVAGLDLATLKSQLEGRTFEGIITNVRFFPDKNLVFVSFVHNGQSLTGTFKLCSEEAKKLSLLPDYESSGEEFVQKKLINQKVKIMVEIVTSELSGKIVYDLILNEVLDYEVKKASQTIEGFIIIKSDNRDKDGFDVAVPGHMLDNFPEGTEVEETFALIPLKGSFYRLAFPEGIYDALKAMRQQLLEDKPVEVALGEPLEIGTFAVKLKAFPKITIGTVVISRTKNLAPNSILKVWTRTIRGTHLFEIFLGEAARSQIRFSLLPND